MMFGQWKLFLKILEDIIYVFLLKYFLNIFALQKYYSE